MLYFKVHNSKYQRLIKEEKPWKQTELLVATLEIKNNYETSINIYKYIYIERDCVHAMKKKQNREMQSWLVYYLVYYYYYYFIIYAHSTWYDAPKLHVSLIKQCKALLKGMRFNAWNF
jgi:hypothetical protein